MENQKIVTQSAQRNKRMVSRLVTNAMLAAVCMVLCLFKIPLGVVEISLSSLPVLLCAFLFGPVDAMAVALCGSFIEQLHFGISPTAPLWIAPLVLMGLVAGLFAVLINRLKVSRVQWIVAVVIAVVISEAVLTAANTAALYLDAKIVGYTVKALLLILPTRLINFAMRATITSVAMVLLLPKLRKAVDKLQIRTKGKKQTETENKAQSQG